MVTSILMADISTPGMALVFNSVDIDKPLTKGPMASLS